MAIQVYEANIGAEGLVKVVRYCDYLAEIRRLHREQQHELNIVLKETTHAD